MKNRFVFISSLLILQILLCAATIEERIFETLEVDPIGRYPYMVAIVEDVEMIPGCGGSLVASDWVLSSARCRGFANYVIIGRHNLTDNSEDYETIEVDWVTTHPNYTANSHDNDYMMLKLVDNSTYVTVTLDDGSSDISDGTAVTLIGWGTKCGESDVLMEEELSMVTSNFCNESYLGNITYNMICAESDDQDSCEKDYGVPLIIKGDDDDASGDILVGLFSFGEEFLHRPSVFTSVRKNIDWIQNEIANGTDPNAFDFDFGDFDLLGTLIDILFGLGICKVLIFFFNLVVYYIIF